MSKRDILKFEGCAKAWSQALAAAGIGLGDLSFVETHDCFTIAELIEYEAMGLGAGGRRVRAPSPKAGPRRTDGCRSIPPAGSRPRATRSERPGVSMHALAAMQLTESAGDIQVKNARLGGLFNMGGAAVANYVSILERIK